MNQTADSILLRMMLDHNAWATRLLIDVCRGLDGASFHRDHGFGPGSVHDTLLHIIAAMRRWTDRMAGRPDRPLLDRDGQRRSQDQLRALLDEVSAEFADAAGNTVKQGHLEERGRIAIREWPQPLALPRVAMICHVLTHGVHHRAQVKRMLAIMGVRDLPDEDVISMVIEGPPA